jgi:3-deoxy-D-manno-octulosonate 8-phosphate phosphatase KdsC-like HAD superfamily phosphatase
MHNNNTQVFQKSFYYKDARKITLLQKNGKNFKIFSSAKSKILHNL